MFLRIRIRNSELRIGSGSWRPINLRIRPDSDPDSYLNVWTLNKICRQISSKSFSFLNISSLQPLNYFEISSSLLINLYGSGSVVTLSFYELRKQSWDAPGKPSSCIHSRNFALLSLFWLTFWVLLSPDWSLCFLNSCAMSLSCSLSPFWALSFIKMSLSRLLSRCKHL